MRKILFTSNSIFSLVNFRLNLIIRLKNRRFDLRTLAPNDEYKDILQKHNIAHKNLKLSRKGTNPIREFVSLMSIFLYIFYERPYAIYSFTIKNCIYVGICRNFFDFRFFPTITGLGSALSEDSLIKKLIIILYKFSLLKSEIVFCQNKDIREFMLKHSICAESKCTVISGSGVDLGKFKFTPMHKEEGGKVFLFVGRLLQAKGVDIFIGAARSMLSSHPSARFLIVGSPERDDPDSYFEKMLADVEQLENTTYCGFVRDVRPIIERSHCVVLPSSYNEGVPRVLLESGAIGRVLITTNRPGCRDVIEEGRNGFLIEEGKVDSLVEKMQKVISLNNSQLDEYGCNSRKLIEDKFDEKCVISEYMRYLSNVPEKIENTSDTANS